MLLNVFSIPVRQGLHRVDAGGAASGEGTGAGGADDEDGESGQAILAAS
jgi:hypothetical protein